jgi:protein-L-isoaspartate(D-aspartate) O-methyltransferase
MTSQRTRDRLVAQLREAGIVNEDVLRVIAHIPRHLFIDEALASRAYDNTALPIGHGQTISQPYVVARMTEALIESGPLGKVLEIGTGSGYQTAVLASLAQTVYSIERVEPLLDQARGRVRGLGLANVVFRLGDGTVGWRDEAPFDAVLVAAAPESVPDGLRAQLADGGRMVIPEGPRDEQRLLLIQRDGQSTTERELDRVRFVPLL